MQIIKDNMIITWVSISIILLASIFLSILTPVPNEVEKAEKIIETEIYTTDVYDYNSIVNRLDQVEIDLKLLKIALKDEPITNLVEDNSEGGKIINWPPKFRIKLKAPSSE